MDSQTDSKPGSKPDSKLRRLFFAVLCIAASAVAFFYGIGLHPHWYLMWLAPLPIFFLAPCASRWTAVLAAFLAFALGQLTSWGYYRAVTAVPITILALFGPAVLFAGLIAAFRAYAIRRHFIRATLIVPAAWVAFEYLNAASSPHSTFANLAYTQMDFLPILQITALTGIWSISFLLFLLPSAIAIVTAAHVPARQRLLIGAGTFVVFAAVLGYGFHRLHTSQRVPQLTIALLDTDARPLYPRGPAAVDLVRSYAQQIPQLAQQGAQLVVIPEKIGRFTPAEVSEADQILSQSAKTNRLTIVAGFHHLPNLNESRVYSPDGALVATYEKHHMLPAFESDLLSGTSRITLDQPSGKWGLEICKDMDFPKLSRQYGNDGAGLLIVPAWDFVDDGWLHGRMAILRGVESGFSIARAPKQGILTVTDDRGRVLAQRTTGPSFSSVITTAPVVHDSTLYDRAGDWFAWLDLALLAAILLSSLNLRPQSIPSSRDERRLGVVQQ